MLLFVGIVVSIGRWSDDRAWIVCMWFARVGLLGLLLCLVMFVVGFCLKGFLLGCLYLLQCGLR